MKFREGQLRFPAKGEPRGIAGSGGIVFYEFWLYVLLYFFGGPVYPGFSGRL
jgi:hypothetical protein